MHYPAEEVRRWTEINKKATSEMQVLHWGRLGRTDCSGHLYQSQLDVSGRKIGNWMEGRESDEFFILCGSVPFDFMLR